MTSDKLLDGIQPGPAARKSPCAACDIRDISICAALETDELKHLEEIVTRVVVQARETIFREADPADYLFNVTQGTVKVYKLLVDGRRQITGFFFPGDFLGLAHLNKYAYSAEAIEEVGLCRFSRRKLEKMLELYPKLERRLLQTASNELASA
jgi:CRP/FNR family transcriptional regulator